MNIMLRDQLDRAHLANQQLTDDLRRTSTELQTVREDYTKKTRDWKEEERVGFAWKSFVLRIVRLSGIQSILQQRT